MALTMVNRDAEAISQVAEQFENFVLKDDFVDTRLLCQTVELVAQVEKLDNLVVVARDDASGAIYGSLLIAFDAGRANLLDLDLDSAEAASWSRTIMETIQNDEPRELVREIAKVAKHWRLENENSQVRVVTVTSPSEHLSLTLVSSDDALLNLGRGGSGQKLMATYAMTAQVQSRRSDEQLKVLHAELSYIASASSTNDAYSRALDKAMTSTSSSHGAIYMSSGQHIRCVAQQHDTTHNGRVYPEGSPSDRSTAQRSYQQGVSFRSDPDIQPTLTELRTDGDETEQTLSESRNPNRPAVHEIAIPIHSPHFGYSPLGVLVLAREADLGGHTIGEIEHARQLAARFLSIIYRTFTDATLELADLLKTPSHQYIRESKREFFDIKSSTPRDFCDTQYDLQTVVDALTIHPHIDSASIRLLSIDRTHLVRVAISPSERRADNMEAVAIDHLGTVVAACFRSREEIDLPNLDRKEDIRAHGIHGVARPESRDGGATRGALAEYCVPIWLDGHVVGTLNCESRRKEALSDAKVAIRAIADIAGAILSMKGRDIERISLQLSTQQFATSHTILGVSDLLKKRAQDSHDPFLEKQSRALVAALTDSVHPLSSEAEQAAGALREVFDLAVRSYSSSSSVQIGVAEIESSGQPKPLDQVVSPRVARCSYLSLVESIQNAYRNSPPGEPIDVLIELDDGKPDEGILVTISNKLRGGRLAPPVKELFRYPTGSEDDRIHVGAFTSGIMLRSIGGDIWVSDYSAEHLAVRLRIPYLAGGESVETQCTDRRRRH